MNNRINRWKFFNGGLHAFLRREQSRLTDLTVADKLIPDDLKDIAADWDDSIEEQKIEMNDYPSFPAHHNWSKIFKELWSGSRPRSRPRSRRWGGHGDKTAS